MGKQNKILLYKMLLLKGLIIILIPLSNAQMRGWISPGPKVHALVGSNVTVNCTIDLETTNGRNSSYLHFFDGDSQVPEENTSIVDSATITLNLENVQPMQKTYQCLLNESGIDYTDVFVGFKPFKVSNFKCISDNWQNLTCSFDKTYNPLPTQYTVKFWPGTPETTKQHKLVKPEINSISKSKFTVDHYQQVYEKYTFEITGNNKMGNQSQIFEINNFASVRPREPLNVASIRTTSDSVTLNWTISYKLVVFPIPLIHQVIITSEHSNRVWREVNLKNLKYYRFHNPNNATTPVYELLIDDLEYAHTWYDVRIRVRVATADEKDEEMWSNYTSYQFQTNPRIPDTPPETDIGGFHINDYNDIVLYWKELPVEKQNGKNSGYNITEVKENGHVVNIPETSLKSKIMAKYKTMRDNEYEFTIHSSNSEGLSEKGSVIKVPPRAKRPGEPTKLKKILKNGEYELSWRQPVRSAIPVESYTVFWCVSKSESPNQCETSIDFRRVNASTFDFKLVTNDVINFAVSANSFNSSSGMIWALCTAADGNDIGKLKTIWIPKMEATFMEIQWKLECVDSSIVVGYNLTYCPITSPKNLTCQSGTEKSLDIVGITHYNLTGLSPYTTYKTMISMFSKTRHGPPSEPLVKTTLEAAPSPPLNLVARDVRNTSMELYWDAPANLNGVLMFYEIWYNNQFKKYNDNDIREKATLNFKLEDLKSFTEYKIIVKACTIECSMNSNSIDIKTKIGVPSSVQVEPKSSNDSRILISWKRPVEPAGKLDYYEIRTAATVNNVVTEQISKLNVTSCYLELDCQSGSGHFEVNVRAVNIIQSPHAEKPQDSINDILKTTKGLILDSIELADGLNEFQKRDLEHADELAANYAELENDRLDYLHDNREPMLAKRHSNAEIDNNYSQTFQTHKSKSMDDKNFKYTSQSKYKQNHPQEEIRMCHDIIDPKLKEWIELDIYAHHLQGNWSTPYMHSCSYSSFANLSAICILALAAILGCGFVSFDCWRKFKRIKDINVELPEGLKDINKDSKVTKNTLDDVIPRSNHITNADEQEESLLRTQIESSSNSSTVSHSAENNSNCESNEAMDDSESEPTEDDHKITSIDNIDNTPYTIMHSPLTNMESISIPIPMPMPMSMPMQMPPQIKAPKPIVAIHPTIPQHMPQNFPVISNASIPQPILRPGPNGYVPFAKPSTGYTQLNTLLNPKQNDLNRQFIEKTPIVTSTDEKGISGYVTHKQLADFGQRMQ